jgi:uncharacterized membrane protein
MAYCPNCGAQVDGRFCAKCGTAVDAASTGPAAGSAGPAPVTSSAGMTDNVAGALCYLLGFITGILFLVLEPYKKIRIVRFHAFQSIFVSVGLMILHFVIGALSAMMFWISMLLSMLLSLGGLLLWLYLMWKTYQNQKVVLPVVGPLAEQQA